MFIYQNDAKELISSIATSVIAELKEKSDFLLALLKEDDWSFVIKMHAIIEAAVTQLVVAHVETKLGPFLDRLLLGGQFGKLALCEHLGLLDPEHRRFIRWFSELRNPLVHRLEKIDFTFEAHLRGLDKPALKRWKESIVWFSADDAETQRVWKTVAIDQPKVAIFQAAFQVVGHCVVWSHHSKGMRAVRNKAEQTMKEIMASGHKVTPPQSLPKPKNAGRTRKKAV